MGIISIDCILNGVHFREPIEWRGLQVLATFDKSAVQANISLENVTFVNEAAKQIRDYVSDTTGLGIFQALPVTFEISDGINTIPNLEYYIDFTQDFKIISPVKVSCRLVKKNGLNDLETRISALTYGFLNTQNILAGDFINIPVRVVPFDKTQQLISLALFEFMLVKEGSELVKQIAKDINTITSLIATGGVTSPAAGLKEAAADLIIQLAYLAVIVVQLIKLTKKFIELFFGMPKQHKGITLFKALQRCFEHLGYGFNTSISDLTKIAYLPSNPDELGLTKGIPQAQDYGYRCSEMVNLVLRMFNARMVIINNVVELHQINSAFFRKSATYNLPDVLYETIEYNTDEYRANRIISFQTDISDEYTVKKFTGTNLEVITKPTKTGDRKLQLNKGFEEIALPVALANNIDGLTDVETDIVDIVGVVDKLFQQFGNATRFSSTLPILQRSSAIMVSGSNWSVPKVVALNSKGRPLVNQRLGMSAKYLYNTYYKDISFLPSNPFGQKRLFRDVTIPFGLSSFLKLINNSYLNGGKGKMESVKWSFDADKAVVDYWVNEVYTYNLTEIQIEP